MQSRIYNPKVIVDTPFWHEQKYYWQYRWGKLINYFIRTYINIPLTP
jgi:hypothetical protein